MNCKIADLNIEISADETTKIQSIPYISDFSVANLTVSPKSLDEYNQCTHECDFKTYQYLTCGSDFYRQLLNYNGMMLHSSSVVVDNKAYLFSAPCGTGKSTHTGKWLELFGDRAYILNDDKPAIRIMDDGIYAYGTPWSGKHDISANKKVPLQGICFLERDTENWIKPMDAFTAVTRLYHGSLKRLSPEQIDKLMGIIDELVKRIPIWTMGCLPNIEAAKTSFEAMSKAEVK